jgi:hypothetical protein
MRSKIGYVAVTQMGAHGNFSDERLGLDLEHYLRSL